MKQIDKTRPEIRMWKNWPFLIFTASVVGLGVHFVITKQIIALIWMMAAWIYSYAAEIFKGYADDFCEIIDNVLQTNSELSDLLRDQDRRIAELQVENESLRSKLNSKK